MRKISANSILLFILVCGVFSSINSRGQSWLWAKSSSCSSGNELGLLAIDKVSSNPGIYAVGDNLGDSVCVPGHTIHNLADSVQLFIIKYDTSGNILWVVSSSTNGQCAPMNITTDTFGNLFVLGMLFTDSVSFDTQSIKNPNYKIGGGVQKNHCYFIMKIDPLGNILWSKCGGNVGVIGENLVIGGIAIDNANNIYVSASFDDSILQIDSHVYTNVHKDSDDVFIAKYDATGNFIWCKTFGGVGDEHGGRLLIGKNNRLYLEGWFNSPFLSFGSTTLSLNGSFYLYNYNVFLTELDTAGNTIWSINPTGNAYTFALALDNDNNIYIGGAVYDTFMAFGAFSFTDSALVRGSFIAKIDTSGNTIWAKFIHPLTHKGAYGKIGTRVSEITVDPCNNVWLNGRTVSDSMGIDNAVLFHTVPTAGTDPMLFAGFNSTGTLLQSFYLKTAGDDNAGMVSDCKGNIYVAGDAEGLGKFVFGSDTVYSYGKENMFLAKYNPNLGCSVICGTKLVPESQNDLIQNSKLTIFPNPTKAELTISFADKIKQLTIFNLIGQTVYTRTYDTENVLIDVSGLPSSIYFIKINGMEVGKFMKQ